MQSEAAADDHGVSLFAAVWADLQRIDVLWQVAVIAGGFGIAWFAARGVHAWFGRQRAGGVLAGAVRHGIPALKRVLWPLLAMTILLVARPFLAAHHAVGLLTLAIALLGWLALVRVIVYGMRYALPKSALFSVFERITSTVIWGAFALHVTGAHMDVIAFLHRIAIPLGKQSISLWTMITAVVWVLATLMFALWLGAALDRRLMRADTLDPSLRVALSRLARAFLVLVGVLIALPLVGIDLTVLSVFGGALGVGLGFGLQKIASNYASGFIILFDRSLRIGDIISIESFSGQVRNITARYVVIRAPDGREAIIPNEKLITDTVLNHSFSDREVRVAISVQVSYATEVERTLRLMEAVAARHPRVIEKPAPLAVVTGFAESGIDLELGLWIHDPENGVPPVRSDVSVALLEAFRREGVEIPIPQREIRVVGRSPTGVDPIAVGAPRVNPGSTAGIPVESGDSADRPGG